MKRKKYLKKAAAGISAFVIGTSAAVPAVTVQAAAPGEIEINPAIRYQTLKGWGTSLCWWGNIIGSWGDQDFNGDGRPDREEIAELAFSPEYLNLNIVRYNVGGGDKEDTSIKRCEGLVPGWTEDMTGTKDSTGEFDPDTFYAKETEEMADAGQLWMLEQANAYRQSEGDIINEVFSNSPPYYMTKSGSSTGGYSWDLNNLKDDQYDEFAQYMGRAAKWIDNNLEKKFGTGVSYIEPLNEPDTSYWQNGSTKQEGCIFNTGELQSKAYREMAAALESEGLTDIQITGTDETALWNAINSFNRLDDDVKENMTTIGAHTYSGNDSERRELRRTAESYDKDLWMSEVTKGGGSHWDGCHDSMDAVNARSQSEGIMADLKQMQSTAWIAWLLADSEYECLQTDSNWGLIHTVFEKDGPVPDYHTNLVNGDGSKKDWVPDAGYWAVTKQFYTMMQYSKYLKDGYTMVEIEDGNMCAALSPKGDELVIVAQNFGNERNTSVDLRKVPGAASAEIYRTSDTESCELVETQDVADGVMDVTLPNNSVSTFVIRSADGSAVCNMEDSYKTVDADVVKPDAEWTSETDKFTYSGNWGESDESYGGGKYSTAQEASVTFTFEGDQAVIYGTKSSDGAVVNVQVDGEDKGEISLEAEGKDGEVMLFDTEKLEEGTHTVTLSKAAGQGNKLIEINYARVISGEFTEEVHHVEDLEDVYTVAGTQPELPETVTVVTNKGNTVETAVTWNTEDVDFTENVIVYGTLEEFDTSVSVNVKVIEADIQYFVDCNSPESPRYQTISQATDLLNDVPDQAYTEGSWGYRDTYGEYNGDINDHYDTGWYAYGGQDIEYTFPLKAGTYQVTFGFKEWWNQSRPMTISVTKDGVTEELGASDTWENGNKWNTDVFEVVCEKDGEVTFTVAKAGSADPVLSFIQIQGEETQEPEPSEKVDFTSLNQAVTMAEKLTAEEDAYTADSLEAVKTALETAKTLMEDENATQEQADAAFLELITACAQVENKAQKTGLKAAIDGAEAILADTGNLAQYATESVEAVRTALADAKLVYENDKADQAAINGATTELLTKVTCLLTENEDAQTRLDILIQMAEALLVNKDQYTEESVQALEDALKAAKDVAGNKEATEEQQKEAYDNLAEAMTKLVRKANKEELKNALAKAEEILGETGTYVENSLEGLKEAADAAQAVYDKDNANQEEISDALKTLIAEILEVRMLGDVNLDGVVDTGDAVKVLRSSAELEELTEEQAEAADVNFDQKADISDAAKILQYAAEKMDTFK